MTEDVLTFTRVTKKYKYRKVLDEVSLTVKKGNIYGLIGRNGAGKTTIMKVVAELSKTVSSGEIFLFGNKKGTKNYSKGLCRLGAVIEEPSVYPHLTVYQNMKVVCIQKGEDNYPRIRELLDLVKLTHMEKIKVRLLSLEMRQRLGIAMALVNNPDILLLDEPFNGLDPIDFLDFREILKRINCERQTTLLISSHNLMELYQIADQFGFLDEGVMLQEISKKDFDRVSTKEILLDVEDIKEAAIVLYENQITHFYILSNFQIRIVDEHLDMKVLNQLVVKNNLSIKGIKRQRYNLDEYLLKLVSQE